MTDEDMLAALKEHLSIVMQLGKASGIPERMGWMSSEWPLRCAIRAIEARMEEGRRRDIEAFKIARQAIRA